MDRQTLAGKITVAIVEDEPVVVEGVRSWIERDPLNRVTLVDSAAGVDDILRGPGANADVLLLDLRLNGVMVTDRVAELCAAGRRVVVFSSHDDPATVTEVMEAGAAFVAKHEARQHCVDVIVATAADRPHVTPSVAGALVATDGINRPKLSERERTALLLWIQSMSKASVAKRMGVREVTVRQYINRARVKYAEVGREAPTKTALLARAIEDGLIRADEIHEYQSTARNPPGRTPE